MAEGVRHDVFVASAMKRVDLDPVFKGLAVILIGVFITTTLVIISLLRARNALCCNAAESSLAQILKG